MPVMSFGNVCIYLFKTRQQQLLLIGFVVPVALKANTKPKTKLSLKIVFRGKK